MTDSPSPETSPAATPDTDSLLSAAPTPAATAPDAVKSDTEPSAEVKYEFKDVPEGYDTKELTEFAKANKLSPESAQALLSREAASNKATQASLDKIMKEDWVNEIKNDKAIGGQKLEESKATARRAVDTLPPDVQKAIFDAGLGNHPALFRAFHAIGTRMREDKIERDRSTDSSAAKSVGEQFYSK